MSGYGCAMRKGIAEFWRIISHDWRGLGGIKCETGGADVVSGYHQYRGRLADSLQLKTVNNALFRELNNHGLI